MYEFKKDMPTFVKTTKGIISPTVLKLNFISSKNKFIGQKLNARSLLISELNSGTIDAIEIADKKPSITDSKIEKINIDLYPSIFLNK